MRSILDEIHRAGAELVVVGNGKPLHATRFKDDQNINFPIYVDPGLKVYEAAGLKRSMLSTIRPGLLVKAVKAARKGLRQGGVQGDPWQQGGVFIITPDGRTMFRQINEDAGDHASNDAICKTFKELAHP